MASGSSDRTVRVWDPAQPAQEPLVLRGHEHWVTAVACFASRDLLGVVSASHDLTTRVWDALTGLQLLLLKGAYHLTECLIETLEKSNHSFSNLSRISNLESRISTIKDKL